MRRLSLLRALIPNVMSPDDVRTVQRSWVVLHRRREPMLLALTRRFASHPVAAAGGADRAQWLFDAVAALVGLLSSPSQLEARACQVGALWPISGSHPSFAVEGCAWMASAAECSPAWTPAIDRAWRQAWMLLSDVLAAETLAPFSDDCR